MSACQHPDKSGRCSKGISDPAWCKECSSVLRKSVKVSVAKSPTTRKPFATTDGGVSTVKVTTHKPLYFNDFESKRTGSCYLSGWRTSNGMKMTVMPKYIGVANGAFVNIGASSNTVQFVCYDVARIVDQVLAHTSMHGQADDECTCNPMSPQAIETWCRAFGVPAKGVASANMLTYKNVASAVECAIAVVIVPGRISICVQPKRNFNVPFYVNVTHEAGTEVTNTKTGETYGNGQGEYPYSITGGRGIPAGFNRIFN